jgi:hypothetical protein
MVPNHTQQDPVPSGELFGTAEAAALAGKNSAWQCLMREISVLNAHRSIQSMQEILPDAQPGTSGHLARLES